ncbi:MAG: roadblock/LC7 domain-containing protein [Acidobacteria bacterium]|nr:roadblock/LC7 domain-containing protein [Acidobacteriota bacterium]
MSVSDLILHEEEHRKITHLAERLLRDANARFVSLIDRNGQPIAWAGSLPDVDRTALASLAAGNVAATEGLARMIGERSFCSMYHEGESDHLYLSSIGPVGILVVAFDERSSLGLVRLRVRQITSDMEGVFDDMLTRSRAGVRDGGGNTPFAEITDDDIDSLFADGF